jgi:hypothetical protein
VAGETILGTAVVPIRATLDQLDRDLSEAKAKADAAAKKIESSFAGLGQKLSGVNQQMASVGASLSSKLASPLQALGRLSLGAVTSSVNGLGSAFSLPARAASSLASVVGGISSASVNVLRGAVSGLGSVLTAPIRAVGTLASAVGRITAVPINALRTAAGGLGSAFTAPIRAIGGLTSVLGKIGLAAIGIKAMIIAVGGMASAIMGPVNAAVNLNKQIALTNAVFGKSAAGVINWSKTVAQSLGIAESEALGFNEKSALMLENLGIGAPKAATMAEQILKIASAEALVKGIPIADAYEAIYKGVTGATKGLKDYGIVLTTAQIKQEAVRLGLAKSTKSVSDNAMAQARLSLILKGTAKAQDYLAKNGTGIEQSQKKIAAAFQNVKDTIGNALLPTVATLISKFGDALPGALEKITPLIETVGKVLGGVADVVSGAGWTNLYLSFQDIFGPDMAYKVKMVVEEIGQFGKILKNAFQTGNFAGVAEEIKRIFSGIDWANVWGTLKGLGEGLLTKVQGAIGGIDWSGIWSTAKGIAGTVTTWLGTQFAGINWASVWAKVKVTGGDLASKLPGIVSSVTTWLGNQFAGVKWADVWSKVTGVATDIGTALGSIVSDVTTWLGAQWQSVKWADVWAEASSIGSGLIAGIPPIANTVLEWLKSVWVSIKWADVWGQVKMSAADIGAADVTTAIDGLMSSLKSLGDWLGSPSGKAVMGFFGTIAVELAVYTVAVSAAAIATTGLEIALAALAAAAGIVASPFVIAGVAIAALVGGFIYAYNSSEGFRTAVGDLGSTLGKVASDVGGFIGPQFAALGGTLSTVWKALNTPIDLSGITGPIGAAVSSVGQSVASVGSTISTQIELWKSTISDGFASIGGWIGGAWKKAVDFSTMLGDWLDGKALAPYLKGLWDGLKKDWDEGIKGLNLPTITLPTLPTLAFPAITLPTIDFQPTLDAIKSDWQNFVDNVIPKPVKQLVDLIVGGFQSIYDLLVGKSIVPDTIAAIQAAWNGLTKPITDTVNGIRDAITGAFGTAKGAVDSLFAGLSGIQMPKISFNAEQWVLDNIAQPLANALKGAPLGLGDAAQAWANSLGADIKSQQAALGLDMSTTVGGATTSMLPNAELHGTSTGAAWSTGAAGGVTAGQLTLNSAALSALNQMPVTVDATARAAGSSSGMAWGAGAASGIPSKQGSVNSAAAAMVNKATAVASSFAYSDGLTIGQRISAGLAAGLSKAEAKLAALRSHIDNLNLQKIADAERRLGFASGTSSAPGGIADLAERGGEIVYVPRPTTAYVPKGAQVFTAPESRRMLSDARGAPDIATSARSIGVAFPAGIEVALNRVADALRTMPEMLSEVQLSLPPRQTGGPVQAGSPYVVGERGPEVFVPRMPGLIVPNDRLERTLVPSSTVGAEPRGLVINGPLIANVTVQNEADEDRLAERISKVLGELVQGQISSRSRRPLGSVTG